MAYARKLTKADLMADGITEITKEGRIFKGDKEIFPHWIISKGTGDYLAITVCERDSDGNFIKVPTKRIFKGRTKETDTYVYKLRTIGLHRAMWAWHYGEVPEGYVVDHINNQHGRIEDYLLDNLQLLTPKQNLAKDREDSTRELKCNLSKPRSFYEDKLAKYEALYEEAKANKDADGAHHLRTNLAQTRARLRYYDSHIEEAKSLIAKKEEETEGLEAKRQSIKDRKILEQYKLAFKDAGNKKMWHEMVKVIKTWDSLEEVQKTHIWDILSRFCRKEQKDELK